MKKLLGDYGYFKVFLIANSIAFILLCGWFLLLKKNYALHLKAFKRSKVDLASSFSEIKQIRRLLVAKGEMERGGERLQPELFFQKQLSKAGIDFKSYHIKPPKERSLKILSGRKKKSVIDREVEVSFKVVNGKKRLSLPRSNWFVALYNCEAGSKRWRLRQLSIRAKEEANSQYKKGNYPAELSDEWFVDKLVFVSREPKK